MLLHLGPIIFGFLIGFVLGTRMNTDSENAIVFTGTSFLAIFILALIVSWQLGPYPYYQDLPIATGFIFAAIGLILGRFVLAQYSK